ncbi:MAG TPA: M48 family metalloprotease [Planctomycetota bacterium]|jgi:Zn-dependent protease with chaperone function|nr:M48 family metalloprotease [Planctomycetota bacterium]
MRLATYDALVTWAEETAARSPTRYHTWVGFFAGLGYLVICSALVLGFILMAVAVVGLVMAVAAGHTSEAIIKFAAITGIFGVGLMWSVVKGLMGGFPPAEGTPLTSAQAPGLFDEVDRLRRALNVPPVHRVVLTDEFNAALYQRPRLGPFGWFQNTLIIGLPLLRQFSVDQARAVIAHELGHLRGEHGRFGAKIHRLRVIWSRLTAGNNTKLLGAFLRWYAPRFNAYTFVMARMHEREADLASAELCTPTAAGSALMRAAVIGRVYGRFWERISVLAAREAEPPADIFNRLDRSLAEPPPEARRWLHEELKRSNSREDTHPCLRERLELIGYVRGTNLPPAPAVGTSAADMWLVDARAYGASADAAWRVSHETQWRAEHTQGAHSLARRDALANRAGGDELTIEERWELAALVHHFDGAAAARSPLMVVVALAPTHAAALFRLGSDLLDDGDARGIPLVEAAMFHDREAIPYGTAALRDFADAHGQRDLVAQAENLNEARQEQEELATQERLALPKATALQPHGLQEPSLTSLRSALARHAEIGAADLLRVKVQHLPERPHFLVVVRVAVPWWKPRDQNADTKLVNGLLPEFQIPGSVLVITAGGKHAKLAKAAATVEGARIYTRVDD